MKPDYNIDNYSLDDLAICITSRCQMRCANCIQLCDVAPTKRDDMSFEQIERFMDETLKFKKEWKRIRISGGEPTLHPDVLEISQMLLDFKKKHSPATEIGFTTNGCGEKTLAVLEKLPKEFGYFMNTNKAKGDTFKFVTTLNAPIDTDKNINGIGCDRILLHANCSRVLNAYGFYPCLASAGFDRVMGKDIGIKSLQNVSREGFEIILKELCKYCGFLTMKRSRSQSISDTWRKQIDNYNQSPPLLKRY